MLVFMFSSIILNYLIIRFNVQLVINQTDTYVLETEAYIFIFVANVDSYVSDI